MTQATYHDHIKRGVEQATGMSIEYLTETPLSKPRLGQPLRITGANIETIDTGFGLVKVLK